MAVKHILVSGKVQGVGFRRFVQKRARQNSMVGWTRNLSDGRVEIFVEGSDSGMESFIDWVRRGPPGSVVEQMSAEDAARPAPSDEFLVLSDGDQPDEACND